LKIYIFEPHPDDILFGPGPMLLDWIEEGNHDIHIITITDGRACYSAGTGQYTDDVAQMTEDDVAEMRIQEAKEAAEFLGLPERNHHLLYFHDADGQKYVEEAIEKVKKIVEDPDQFVIPSDNNEHVDHQATHDIAVGVAKELKLTGIDFFVYFIPTYGKFKEDSQDKQIKFTISQDRREKLLEWYQIYQSQHKMKFVNKMYTNFLKNVEERTYALFDYQDLGNYYNF
jgi:LmbE family N-acetylglucosaminyl deacetylase